MNDTVTALILNQSDYRDSDVIIQVMTAEYGRISFICAGARKMTSKNAGSILPYTKAEIQFDHHAGRTLFRLKTARTKTFWRTMHEDLVQSSAAAVIADACMSMSMSDIDNGTWQQEFTMLETAFELLDQKKDPTTVIALYLADLMELNGFAPDVDECVICGSTTVTALSAKEGGFLCEQCRQRCNVPASSPADLRRFRLLVKGGLEHADIIESVGGAEISDLEILCEMLRLHAGCELRSFAFYRRFSH